MYHAAVACLFKLSFPEQLAAHRRPVLSNTRQLTRYCPVSVLLHYDSCHWTVIVSNPTLLQVPVLSASASVSVTASASASTMPVPMTVPVHNICGQSTQSTMLTITVSGVLLLCLPVPTRDFIQYLTQCKKSIIYNEPPVQFIQYVCFLFNGQFIKLFQVMYISIYVYVPKNICQNFVLKC